MRIKVIINPEAGGGYASEIYRTVLAEFRDFEVSYSLTSGPGDATDISSDAIRDGFQYIMCIGGDGTLNEIVQAMAHSDAVLIPVSAGTGSDFVRNLGFKDLASVKNAIKEESFEEIDLGVVESTKQRRYFLNILEVGFGASVMKRVNARKKVRGGKSFTSSVLALIPFFKPYSVRVIMDDRNMVIDLAEMVVANGRYFGGGMLAAPDAELTDGYLEVHIVSGVGRLQLLTKLGKLKNGSYISDPSVMSFRTDSIKLDGKAPVEIDGEDFDDLPVEISVDRRSLKVLFPAEQK